jgi:flagellin
MAGFSIVTNVSSLLAQENLNKTNDLQQTTIRRLTSGLRINSSADDAAGLAIANRFRSDISVLRQGVRNAADGLSTLQTIDGGLNNISLLIDRARTLATQSASGTFTGDRSTLNAEFQSVLGEIDRQAQAVGLDPGGSFNAALSVFIGGGRSNNNITEVTNGSVQIDLSNSSVNANRLGLKGVQALGGTEGTTDLGASSATNVENIVGDATNTASVTTTGFTEFFFAGPGFADDEQSRLSVNLSGVVDTTTLVSAVNDAIDGFTASSAAGQSFKNANITAVVNTDSTGKQQLAFTSSNTAFQVQAGDRVSNALLGNFSAGATGASLSVDVVSGTAAGDSTAANTISVVVQGGGLVSAQTVSITVANADTQAEIFSDLETQFAANTTLASAGFSIATDTAGDTVTLSNNLGEKFRVEVAGDVENLLGFGVGELGGAGGTDAVYSEVTDGGALAVGNDGSATFSVLIDGAGSAETFSVTVTTANNTDAADIVQQINSAIAANTTLSGSGLIATEAAGVLKLESTTGTTFLLSVDDDDANAITGFTDVSAAGLAVATNGTLSEAAGLVESTVNAGGAQSTTSTLLDPTAFTELFFGDDEQNIVVTAEDATGATQSLSITLSFSNAKTLDQAIDAINDQLRASNSDTLQQIVAVKERLSGTADGVRFLSTLTGGFSVGVGDLANDHGIDNSDSNALLLASGQLAGGAVADISSKENAANAVTLLATAVVKLSAVQADVGKGQNQLQFAIGLASTQITNLSAAESRIRDADLAAEAANLTRSSIAQQAGVAALAQANAAPQAVLALLRG